MNIFYLDSDPIKAAEDQCDKHCVKMILETAQLLCTAHHVLGSTIEIPYKKTHQNHPSAVWVRESTGNYDWLVQHFIGLNCAYSERYNKTHKSWDKLMLVCTNYPTGLPVADFTEPPKCMPDEYKCDSVVQSYRNYYIGAKAYMAQWNHSSKPEWWEV